MIRSTVVITWEPAASGRVFGGQNVSHAFLRAIRTACVYVQKGGKKIGLEVNPVRKLSRPERAELEQEAERFGVFLGLELVLTVG